MRKLGLIMKMKNIAKIGVLALLPFLLLVSIMPLPKVFAATQNFGYTTKGASSFSIENYISGSQFASISAGTANSITAYIGLTGMTPQTFGDTTIETSTASIENTIRGARFAPTYSGTAQSLTAYIDVELTFGNTGGVYQADIENYIKGSSFACPDSGTIQSITAYIYCSSVAKNMKAAIYNDDATHTFVASTEQKLVALGESWVTFNFADPKPSLTAGNSYVLAVWSYSGSGYAYLYYDSGGATQGHYQSRTYDGWPSPASFTHNNIKYRIYCTYTREAKVKAAIYSDAHTLIASTEEKTVSADGWVTFNFVDPKPSVTASTYYVLVAWSDSAAGSIYMRRYDTYVANTGHYVSQTYDGWPSSPSFTHDTYQYSIYCTYTPSRKVKAAIYNSSHQLIASTEEKAISAEGWVTFNFPNPKPSIAAATNYVLFAWSESTLGDALMYYDTGSTNQGHYVLCTYGSWPLSASFTHTTQKFSIYCTVQLPKVATTTSTSLSASTITLGGSVTDTATVTSSSGTPTGSVTFYVKKSTDASWTQLGAVKTLVGGSATSDSYTPTSAGTWYFKAAYSGSDDYFGSESGETAEPLTVEPPLEPPVADAGGPYMGTEGSPITFDAGGSTDSDGTIDLYEWDWDNDGTYDESSTSPTITHQWPDDYAGTVGLRVTDNDGLTDTDTTSVTVNNVAPTVEAGSDQAVDEGYTVSFSGSFTDPSTADTHTIEWNFGDGGTASGTLTPTHAYGDNGVYTVTLTVTDDDDGVGTDTLTLTVNNIPPTVDAGPDQTVDVGQTVSFSGSFSDPGWLDTHTFSWDFGDGETAINTLTPTHAYNTPDTYTVTLTVTDDDGDASQDTLTIEVKAPPAQLPVASFTESATTVTVGETISFDASASYDLDGTIESYGWDFGDGTSGTGVTTTHAYTTAGTYTVTLTVTDNDGLTDTATAEKTVEPRIPPGPGIPEFGLSVSIVTSIIAALYILIRRRTSNRKE